MPKLFSRRVFLCAGAQTIAMMGLPLRAAAAFARVSDAPRWGLVVDMRRFADPECADRAAKACHATHNVPVIPHTTGPNGPDQSLVWMHVMPLSRVFPGPETPHLPEDLRQKLETTGLPALCNHCDNPPCVRVCPTGATFKCAAGTVAQDPHRCIGCRYCMAACPYGARSFNFRDPIPFVASPNPDYPFRKRGMVEKCTFCPERIAKGLEPHCVAAVPDALIFGDLRDPGSPPRRLLAERTAWRRKAHLGTEPAVYYVF